MSSMVMQIWEASLQPQEFPRWVDGYLASVRPFTVITCTAGATLTLLCIYLNYNHKQPLIERLKKTIFKNFRKLPFVKKRIQEERQKAKLEFEKKLLESKKDLEDFLNLPMVGKTKEEILELTRKHVTLEEGWKKGLASGTVYSGNEALTEVMAKVYEMAAWSNPLHVDAFPGVRKMEAEIVRMGCNLFNGGPESCGVVSSGGTESIILACKAYRDWATEEKGISNPTMVIPVTAHAAFDKAAQLLNMGIRHVQVDPVTMKVDLKAMRSAITSSTCMLVGSAPQFPHGVLDDIKGIAQMGKKYGIPVHVDACLGGFLIAFMEEAGYPLKPFDFRVAGVTSISADTHKYAFAPKGSSVLMYSEPKYRHYQYFTVVDWPGGLYATATIGGSRAGGIIAACWASLMYCGRQGYVDSTKKIIEVTRFIEKGLRQMDGIYVMGNPHISVVAIGSKSFNIFGLADFMKEKGWDLNLLDHPPGIHICCTLLHTKPGVAVKFLADIKEVVDILVKDPAKGETETAAMYGMTGSVPDRTIIDQLAWSYLDAVYITGSEDNKE